MESDSDGLSVTTFKVEDGDQPDTTRLTITTDVVARSGITGILDGSAEVSGRGPRGGEDACAD
jgi:hypothetical protein